MDFLRPQEMFEWPLPNYEGKIENSKIENEKKLENDHERLISLASFKLRVSL